MGEFACGITICAGSIKATGEPEAWDQWMKKLDENPNAPTYVFIEASVDHDDGATQHRIVFSTDPDSNTVTGSF
jgi:hypothetical protein